MKASLIFLHPVFISLVLTIAISLLFLPDYTKYTVEVQDQIKTFAGSEIYMYDDLDANGYSDRIQTAVYSNGTHCVTVMFEPGIFFQEWDFRGHFRFAKKTYLFTGDYDVNNRKEMYLFSLSHDSILLHIVTDLFNNKPVFQTRFITRVAMVNDSAHVEIAQGEMEDMNGDGFRELIFAVNAGFSLYPRAVFSYDIKNDSLARSPEWGYFTGQITQADINGDGRREIMVNGYATTNFRNKVVEYTDENCWLIALDQNLKFLFPPVQFPDSGYSGLAVWPILNKYGFSGLYGFYLPPLLSNKNSRLIRFDNTGRILRSKEVPGFRFFKTTGSHHIRVKDQYMIGIVDDEGKGVLYDTSFNLVREITLPFPYISFWNMDLNGDKAFEEVVLDQTKNRLYIYHDDFRDIVSTPINLGGGEMHGYLKKEPGKRPILAVCEGNNVFLIVYRSNPLYFLRWIIYAGIFLSILIFIYIIRIITRQQVQKRYETVRKINELQLMVVRNQMDPHFTMNAINSVIGAIHREEKEAAAQSLVYFSRMYRALVLSGDKTDRTLEEEVEFARNYLELERFRFSNKFEYRINIGEDVDMGLKIPKMIIQSPVENAVKHGLLPKSDKGLLTITVEMIESRLVIEVEDNGVGRNRAAENVTEGTGKGLKIMDEFLKLYQSMQKIRIQWEILDLTDEAGNPSGTKVIMKLDFGTSKI